MANEENGLTPGVPPQVSLTIEFTPAAEADIFDAAKWLASASSVDSGAHFLRTLRASIDELTDSLVEGIKRGEGVPPPQGVEAVSAVNTTEGWLLRVLKVRTGKTRARMSASGLWYVFYILPDYDGDGLPDVLKVVAVRHAAAQPFVQS